MNFYEYIDKQLTSLDSRDQMRRLNNIDFAPDGSARFQGQEMLNLSSNDYLGLACDQQLKAEFGELVAEKISKGSFSLAASSSRLLTGNHSEYLQLENLLSEMYCGRAALVFNSGYHANVGMLAALGGKGDLVLSDKLNHASIIDGATLAGVKLKRYRHLDCEHLEEMLANNRAKYRHVFIITESVFSMDGDIANLGRLVELKKKYNAVLIVDEAHGFGVFGDSGCGVCQQQQVMADIDIIISTFGKAACSMGAVAIMNPKTKEYLINKMRSLIFTTALPPLLVCWTRFIVEKMVSMNDRREHLATLANRLRDGLKARELTTAGSSHIVPLIVGENATTLALADKLRNAGLLVFAIRPPTVPFGTARLRFSLNASLSIADIDKILANV